MITAKAKRGIRYELFFSLAVILLWEASVVCPLCCIPVVWSGEKMPAKSDQKSEYRVEESSPSEPEEAGVNSYGTHPIPFW